MYLPIPFITRKRVQSDTTPVLKARAPYCHHHRSASADSTEYWIWNGPEHNSEGDGVQESAEHSDTEDLTTTSPKLNSTSVKDSGLLSRPEKNDISDDTDRERDDCEDNNDILLSNSLLDLVEDDSTSSHSDACSFSSDLPHESFSSLLRQGRQTPDLAYASPAGFDSPLRGLGIFHLTRKDDVSHPFDGLGVVHIHSGSQVPREGGEEVETELSPTFLRDLETLLLVKDVAPSPFNTTIELPTIRMEDSSVPILEVITPETDELLVAPPATPVIPATPPNRNTLTSKIKHALRPRGPSTSVLPSPSALSTSYFEPSAPATISNSRSLTTGSLPTSISTASTTVSTSTSTSTTTSVSSSSSFIRRTCSAFRSQYNLNALRVEHAANTGAVLSTPKSSTSTSPVKKTSNVQSQNKSPAKVRTNGTSGSASSRRPRLRSLQPADRPSLHPAPLTGPTRKVSVSVSMGGVFLAAPTTPSNGLLTPERTMAPMTPSKSISPATPGDAPFSPMTPITPTRTGSKRSLQTHFVRDSKDWKDVRDLSVLGTISSGLKKRGKVAAPVSESEVGLSTL